MPSSFDALVAMAHVASIPRSLGFYQKLGFDVDNTFTPPGEPEPTWAYLECGGAGLMIAKAAEPVVASQQAVLFYLYCEDVAVMKKALEKAGVACGAIQRPFSAPNGEFRVEDPDGYTLMITHS